MEGIASRRRTLFAAAGAVILGGGITSGVAASVADLVPSDLDAELITSCDSYVAADIRHVELCRLQDAMVQPLTTTLNAEWHRLDDLVLKQGEIMQDLEERMTALPALSQAGIRAKAAAVARMTRFYKDENAGALLRSLLADLLPSGRA